MTVSRVSTRSLVQEIVISLVPVVMGLAGLAFLPGHDFFRQGFPSPTTPDFFPSLVSVFLVLLGIGLLTRTRKSAEIQKAAHEPMVAAPVYQTVGIFAAYWLLLGHLGFIVSSALATLALSFIFRERLRPAMFVFAIVFPCVVHFIFKHSANVYLPPFPWL